MLKSIFGSLLLIAAPAAAPTPPPSPSPSPTISAPPAATPLPTPLPTLSPLPTTSPSPTPTPTASPLPTPLELPPDAPPQILAVQLSDPVFHSGELVTGTIVTSTNVAAVEVQLAGHSMRIPRAADPGIWQMSYRMPHIPFFFRGTYTAQVVAMNSAGATATTPVTVSIR